MIRRGFAEILLKLRSTLLFGTAIYMALTIAVAAQSLDQRITVVEQQLRSQIQNVTEPTLQRLYLLESAVATRNLLTEARLVAVEQAQRTSNQLLIAVLAGVLIQLVTKGLEVIGARSKKPG